MPEPKQITIDVPENLGLWLKRALTFLLTSGLLGGGGIVANRARTDAGDALARLERVERMQEQILSAMINIGNQTGPSGPKPEEDGQ